MSDANDLDDASAARALWAIADGVTYLNHGSFGPTPRVVQEAKERWSRRLAANPMDFFLRELDGELEAATGALAGLLGCPADDLLFIENATTAMNVVAATVKLGPGDEVLLNDHEYGAVFRVWERACREAGARVVTATLRPIRDEADVIEPILAVVTPRTKLAVVSHVTSATATVFPVRPLIAALAERGVPTAVDGPHAIAMQDFELASLGCAFYCASLHKWLSAPLGTGFLYVAPEWQGRVRAPMLSWGRHVPGRPIRWQDELRWQGTRDPAGYLAVPAAIEFLRGQGLDRFRRRGYELAAEARAMLERLFGTTAVTPPGPEFAGTMVTVPLPESGFGRPAPDAWDPLQSALWTDYGMEIPVMEWNGRRHLRVSCHLYVDRQDLRRLEAALVDLRGKCW